MLSVFPTDIFRWPHITSLPLFCSSFFLFLHILQTLHFFKNPPAFLLWLSHLPLSLLPSSPHLINSSDTVSHWCSHYIAQGASPLHLPVMDFQCFDRLTCHVVMSPCWVASLCKLFRNAWILSVLLYSFYHHSLPTQSSKAWPHISLLPLHRSWWSVSSQNWLDSKAIWIWAITQGCKAAEKAHHCFNHHLLGGKWSART